MLKTGINRYKKETGEQYPRLVEVLEDYLTDDDQPTYWLHLSEIAKAGMNPRQNWATPYGFYAHPINDEFLHKFIKKDPSVMGLTGEYASIVTVKPSAFMLRINFSNQAANFSQQDVQKILPRIEEVLGDEFTEYLESNPEPTFAELYKELDRFFSEDRKNWSRLMYQVMGIDAISDVYGEFIWEQEPQIVFLNPNSFNVVESLHNLTTKNTPVKVSELNSLVAQYASTFNFNAVNTSGWFGWQKNNLIKLNEILSFFSKDTNNCSRDTLQVLKKNCQKILSNYSYQEYGSLILTGILEGESYPDNLISLVLNTEELLTNYIKIVTKDIVALIQNLYHLLNNLEKRAGALSQDHPSVYPTFEVLEHLIAHFVDDIGESYYGLRVGYEEAYQFWIEEHDLTEFIYNPKSEFNTSKIQPETINLNFKRLKTQVGEITTWVENT